jgi:hypothetical protein
LTRPDGSVVISPMRIIPLVKIGKLNPPTNVTKLIEMRRHVADTGGVRNADRASSNGIPKDGKPAIYINMLGNF